MEKIINFNSKSKNVSNVILNGTKSYLANDKIFSFLKRKLQKENQEEVLSLVKKIRSNELKLFNTSIKTINERGKSFVNLQLNESHYEEALKTLKNYTDNIKINNNEISSNFLGIKFLFSKKNILSEISFNQNYEGKTSKGLRIGDTLEKAFKLYGNPKIISITHAIWNNNLMVNIENRTISKIIIR